MSDSYKTMRINAPKGQKVIFKGERDGLWGGGYANDRLKEGNEYTVEKTTVFKSHSFVVLNEVSGEEFNTVMFEESGEVLEPMHSKQELYQQSVKERRVQASKASRL